MASAMVASTTPVGELETRRAALEERLTKGYAWFVQHGYEPTTATGVDAVDGDRKAEKAEAVWLELLASYEEVCREIERLPLAQQRIDGIR